MTKKNLVYIDEERTFLEFGVSGRSDFFVEFTKEADETLQVFVSNGYSEKASFYLSKKDVKLLRKFLKGKK